MSEPFGSLSLEHSSTVDRVADELRRAVFDGELESGTPLREVALAESLGVSRPTIREALGGPGRRGAGHPRAQPRGLGHHPRPGLDPRRLPGPGGARDRRRPRPGRPRRPRRWRRGARRRWPTSPRRPHDGASYQVLNERHLDFHLSLVGLIGSPRLEAMADQPVRRAPARAGPGRPGPAERTRPGRLAHPAGAAAGERRHRRDRGRARGAPRRRRGRDPRPAPPRRRATGLIRPRALGSAREIRDLAADQRRSPWPSRPGSSTASGSTAPRPAVPRRVRGQVARLAAGRR